MAKYQRVRTYVLCSTCGIKYEPNDTTDMGRGEAYTRICPSCVIKQRVLLGLKPKKQTVKSNFPPGWTFDDCSTRAKELGMSYGYFMAAVNVHGMSPGSRPGSRSLRKQRKGR